eukprot:146800-Pyramimonas_sp.AAC.1
MPLRLSRAEAGLIEWTFTDLRDSWGILRDARGNPKNCCIKGMRIREGFLNTPQELSLEILRVLPIRSAK